MNICFLTRYDINGASSRLRAFQYFEYIKQQNISCEYQVFFSHSYLNVRYSYSSELIKNIFLFYFILVSFLNRVFFILFKSHKFDVFWIEKELFPYLPSYFDFLFFVKRKSYIVDFDDAVFHNYDRFEKSIFFDFFGLTRDKKFTQLLSRAHSVTVGNQYLRSFAATYNKNINIIFTSVDFQFYSLVSVSLKKCGLKIVVGWIGNPSTEHYLKKISRVLYKIQLHYPKVVFRFCGVSESFDLPFSFEAVKWDDLNEKKIIAGFDIGLMPLLNTNWEKGKCGYKIIQYMAASVPFVASPVGINLELISSGGGYLAKTEADWFSCLEVLILNKDLRLKMGKIGHEFGKLNFDKYIAAKSMVKLFNESV